MDYSKIKKLYLDQVDNINKLFNNKNFVALVNNSELSKTNFFDQISVINYLEKKLTDTKLIEEEINESKKKKKKADLIDIKDLNKYDELSKKFKEIFGYATLNEFEDIKKVEEIKDTVSYFNVYLKNTYNHDLQYYLDSKNTENQTFEAERVSEDEFSKAQEQNNNSNQSTQRESKNFFSGFGGSGSGFNPSFGFGFNQGNGSYEEWKKQNILREANLRFSDEVKKGSFYLFKTKPKSFAIIKKILGVLLILVSISWLLVFVSQIVITSTQKSWGSALWYGSSSSASYVSFSTSYLFNFIVNVFIIIYLGFLGAKYLKISKNENEVYGFDKRAAIILVLLIVINSITYIVYLINWFTNLEAVKNFAGGTYQAGNQSLSVSNSASAITAFEVTIWSTVAGLILFIFLLTTILIAWIYAPKVDFERINLKMQQIIKNIEESNQFAQR